MPIKSGSTVPPKEKKPTPKPKADKVTETAATVVAPATKSPEQQPEKPVTTDDAVAGNDTIAGGESLAVTVTSEAETTEQQTEQPVDTDDAVNTGNDTIAGGESVTEPVTFDPKVMVVVGSDIHGMNVPLVHIDDAGFGIHLQKDDETVVNEVIGVTYPRMVAMNNPTAHTVTEPSSRVYAEPYRQSKPHTLNSEAEYLAMQKGVDNHNARLKLETGITIIDLVGV